MAMMRARIEADHPEPLGRTTYMRATTVAVARPVGSMLQTVELMGSLQRAEAPRTARPAAQRIGNSVPRGVVTPRLAALGGRREHVMRLLAQMHAAPDQGSLQVELVASLREEMRALQRERLALLQLAALRPNLCKARAAAGRKTRPPSTLPQVAVLELDGLMRDTESATQLLLVQRQQARREQEAVRLAREVRAATRASARS